MRKQTTPNILQNNWPDKVKKAQKGCGTAPGLKKLKGCDT